MDVAAQLDPEIAAALAAWPVASFDFGTRTLDDIVALHQQMPLAAPPDATETTSARDVVIDDDGATPVTVRIVTPRAAGGPRPCVYWIHGGGYILGSALMPDPRVHHWAHALDCVVVAVEYRLAPECPYPGPLDDCRRGLRWTARHADELGIDPSRVALVGESAGGGLAAALALQLRDEGDRGLCCQVLIYPMIDDRNATVSSHIHAAPVWSREANLLGWRAYLGPHLTPGAPDVPAYAAAARADDLGGLPPAFVCVGTLDVFRDEDIDYARRLLEAGVPTEVHVYAGAPHGFLSVTPETTISKRAFAEIDRALRRAFRGA
jgi:acetyl esterase/lipase